MPKDEFTVFSKSNQTLKSVLYLLPELTKFIFEHIYFINFINKQSLLYLLKKLEHSVSKGRIKIITAEIVIHLISLWIE